MSKQLADDVCALVRSLGGSAHVIQRTDGVYRTCIRMQEHSVGIAKRCIEKIEQVEDEETVCLEVDSPDGLYVTENYIVTHNTTKHTISESFFASFTPNNQFTGYVMGGRILMPDAPKKLIVDAAQIAVTFSRFERGIVERSDHQLSEWYEGLGYWLALAEGFARSNYWPMNEASCGNYGGCPFRQVCSAKTERVRDEFLRAGFVPRVWDPLQTRGDI